MDLPEESSSEKLDLEGLSRIFMTPDEGTPEDLINSLYLVDEMATEQGMADLLEAARFEKLALEVGEDVSPADVAVQVWLTAPGLLERMHAEHHLSAPRSFEYFGPLSDGHDEFRPPSAEQIRGLEGALANWLEGHKRGRSCRVFVFEEDDSVWFMVRHGEPFRREERVVGDEPSSISYRPLKYDVLVYERETREIRVNAPLSGLKKLYRREFGRYLFGDEDYFPNEVKYTLEPIRRDGEKCVVCSDVPGLEWVRLREVHLHWGGPHGEYEIRKASNVFAALRHRETGPLPLHPGLARAGFTVKFIGVKRPRSVTIHPPNVALYARDDDSVRVEEWLRKRGFLDVREDGEADDPLLVDA